MNTELTRVHVGLTEAISRLESLIDPSIDNDSALNLTLLRVHRDLVDARQRLQDYLDQDRPRASYQPSKPMFTTDMEF